MTHDDCKQCLNIVYPDMIMLYPEIKMTFDDVKLPYIPKYRIYRIFFKNRKGLLMSGRCIILADYYSKISCVR